MKRYIRAADIPDYLFKLPDTFSISCGPDTWTCYVDGYIVLDDFDRGVWFGTTGTKVNYTLIIPVPDNDDIQDIRRWVKYGLEQYLDSKLMGTDCTYDIQSINETYNYPHYGNHTKKYEVSLEIKG